MLMTCKSFLLGLMLCNNFPGVGTTLTFLWNRVTRCGIPSLLNFYRPQRSCGQGNIFTPVCHSVHRGGGVSASVHPGIPHPPGADTPGEQIPPGADTPPRSRHHPGADMPLWEQTPPQEQTPPGADMPPRSRHPQPLGADMLPRTRHVPPGADTPKSRHPPRADTPPGADTPWEQTPPPWQQTPPQADTPREADSGIQSMSGRYASYWNAFLLE